jgi:hypothetical protein
MTHRGSYRRDAADSDTGDATAGSSGGTPRWVKIAGVIALLVLVMLVVALLSGGKHGPGRHAGNTGARPALAFGATTLVEHPARARSALRP